MEQGRHPARADATFEIEDVIGQHFYGRLEDGPRAGALTIGTAAGIRNLDMLSVVRISRLGESIWKRMDGAIDLGTSYAGASDLFTLDFAAEGTFKRPKDEFGIDLNVTLTKQTDVEDTRRWNASLDFVHRPPSRWLVSGQALLEQNRELGFELRSSGSVSGGRYLVPTAHDDFLAAIGVSLNEERPVEGETTNNAEYLLTMQYDLFSYDFPKVDIFIGFTAYRNMSVSGRVRLEADISLRRELLRDFNLSIRGYESYDSQPATEGAELNDYGLTFGFGWSC